MAATKARLLACGNNLRELGLSLGIYSHVHGGFFPHVPASGNLGVAGVVGPRLWEAGLLDKPNRLVCPASGWAAHRKQFLVPSIAQLEQARGEELLRLQRMAGGSYGYVFGYVDGDSRYRAVRDQGRPHFAIMADVPDPTRGTCVTPNHGGQAVNVLYEDGHVGYTVSSTRANLDAASPEDIFHNDRGLLQAGLHQDDSVIGPSAATPFPVPVHLINDR